MQISSRELKTPKSFLKVCAAPNPAALFPAEKFGRIGPKRNRSHGPGEEDIS